MHSVCPPGFVSIHHDFGDMAQNHLDLLIQFQALIALRCHVFCPLMPQPQTQFNHFPAEQMSW